MDGLVTGNVPDLEQSNRCRESVAFALLDFHLERARRLAAAGARVLVTIRRRLEHNGVAHDERRDESGERLVQWIVEWPHAQHDTQRRARI